MPSPNPQGIGTTPLLFLPKGEDPGYAHGRYYFLVKVALARVILTGGWWRNVTSVALVSAARSQGDLSVTASARSLNKAVRVNQGIRNTTISCQKNIVDIVPATMDTFEMEAQLVATRRDPVQDFFTLVQGEAFAAAFSFAPGALGALKLLAPVVPSLVKVFEGDSPQQEPALSAALDVDLATQSLRPGYYVVLSAMGQNSELNKPIDASMLGVMATDLLLNGKPVVQASYVVLEFATARYRGIGGAGSAWVDLYEKTSRSLSDLAAGIGDRESVLANALKALYALDELQAEDATYTREEMAIYRKRLRDEYLAAAGDIERPQEPITELSEGEVREREETYDADLDESLQIIAAFEAASA